MREESSPRKIRWFLLTIVSLVVSGMLAQTALATQGGNYKTVSGLNGTRSQVDRYSISQTNGGGGILFVRSQSSLSSSAGLIQAGYHRSLLTGDDCALDGGVVNVFVEWKPVGGNFNCQTFFACCTSDRFAVVKSSTSNYWGGYQNGALLGANHFVGYNTGYALTGGEQQGNYVLVDGCFGCGGATPWQYTTCGGCSYTTISSSTTFNEGGWTVTSDHSPFRVHN